MDEKTYKKRMLIIAMIMFVAAVSSVLAKLFYVPVKYYYVEHVGFVREDDYQRKYNAIKTDPR